MTTPLNDALLALNAFCENNTTKALTFHRGVEREGLRVSQKDGRISHTPHPSALGSPLTHSSVTTDYSESLLEFITGVHPSVEGVIDELNTIHHYVNHVLNEQQECLWPASMPCYLEGNQDVPIANYGESNTGKLKRVYREGLSNRYGRIMQCIAGMHYNFSFDEAFWAFLKNYKSAGSSQNLSMQDFKSESYFALIRNFRRNSWILSYLFGASPAVDFSFLPQGTDRLKTLKSHTYIGPTATSLRMSDLGYQNNAQANLFVCYNEVSTYIETLKTALKTPYQKYQEIGLKVGGEYRQLNTNILQIENEYYSDIRPKRVTEPGEHPSAALQARGVEYIEVRIMDIDPFSKIGMKSSTLYFIDVFLVYCMLNGDDPLLPKECRALRELQQEIATHSRDQAYRFDFGNGAIPLTEQCQHVLKKLMQVAEFLSEKTQNQQYIDAIQEQLSIASSPEKLPSHKVMTLSEEADGFTEAMLLLAKQQQSQWLTTPLSDEEKANFMLIAEQSLKEQAAIEAADIIDFDTYLTAYMKPQ